MKNKNIKNKPKNCGRWLFLHSRFSKIFRGRTPGPPLIKGIHRLYPQNLQQQQQQPKAKKTEPENPPPLKQSTRNLYLGFTEIEKRRRAHGQVPEHCLSFYFVCGGQIQIQISCAL